MGLRIVIQWLFGEKRVFSLPFSFLSAPLRCRRMQVGREKGELVWASGKARQDKTSCLLIVPVEQAKFNGPICKNADSSAPVSPLFFAFILQKNLRKEWKISSRNFQPAGCFCSARAANLGQSFIGFSSIAATLLSSTGHCLSRWLPISLSATMGELCGEADRAEKRLLRAGCLIGRRRFDS